jgi:hypothetical protein
MNLSTKFASTCFALLLAASGAQAISLDDFVPPAEGGTVNESASASQDGDVVQAMNMQDGLSYAYQKIMDDGGDGILTVQTKTGMGIISTATASYNRYENINATMLSKRSAYVKGFTKAQGEMVKYMEGLENNCSSALSDETLTLDTGMESNANSVATIKETCQQTAKGVLAGFITYKLDDNDEENVITVSLASSTKTRAAVSRVGGAVIVSSDPKKAFQHIAREVTTGVVPPLGAKLIHNPENGESIVIGFGSAIVRQNRDKAMQRKMVSLANQQSKIRANSALIAFLKGSEVYWKGGFDESQVEGSQQFDIPADDNGQAMDPVVYDDTRHVFMNSVSASDDYSVITGGQLPPGIKTKSYPSEDGYWVNTISIYMPSATAEAKQASQENREASGRASQARAMQIEGGLAPGSANPKGPSGTTVRDNDF